MELHDKRLEDPPGIPADHDTCEHCRWSYGHKCQEFFQLDCENVTFRSTDGLLPESYGLAEILDSTG